jgi:hypothetical protein
MHYGGNTAIKGCRVKLAQLLGQLGVFLTFGAGPAAAPALAGGHASDLKFTGLTQNLGQL